MSLKLFVVFCFATFVVCEDIKKSDSAVSGADFVPQFQPFEFQPAQPVFGPPQDLTALQQTHVLGNFHHRFHPTRLNPQFGINSQQVVFPQTHIVPPQPTVQDQTTLLQQPLVPPSPQEVLRPPALQENLVPPTLPQAQFKSISNQKTQNSFQPGSDQSIKNSFPSNSPHTIKFSISSQNYNPTQVKQPFVNPSTPPPKINQVPSQGRFVSSSQQNRVINQGNHVNFRPQTTFNSAAKSQQNFQSFNTFNKPDIVSQQSVSFAPKPTFNTAVSGSQDFTTQYQVNFAQNNANQLTGSTFSDKPILSSPITPNFEVNPTDSLNKFSQTPLVQTNFEFRQNDLSQQNQFNQQQFVQPNIEFPQVQQQPNLVQTVPQTQFQTSISQQPQFNIQPSIQSNFELQTQPPRVNPEVFTTRHQESIKVSPTIPQPSPTFPTEFYQKSQETSPSPRPTTVETVTTSGPKYRRPKPIVKEITINLNDKKISSNGELPQLYIKEDRQKEFLELKEQDQKEQRKGKSDKSQEDIINEQIQKLLQSHNLEIIDKDNDSGTESQEAQLNQFSEQFKKKYNYSVQLLNGGSLLREVKQKKKVLTTLPPLPELPEHIKKQYDIKLVNKDDLFKQFDLPGNHKLSNDSSNVFLANGQQLEIVRFGKDGIMDKIPIGSKADGPTTTAKPPKVLFEELTKGVLPPGADFELIKHKENGEIEKVTDLNPAKKVTFVLLEEQPDGSVKVQGVKGNANQEAEPHEEVDSVIKKLKEGAIKLPPSKQASLLTNEIPRINPVSDKSFVTFSPSIITSPAPRSIQPRPSTNLPFYVGKDATEQGPSTDFSYSSPYSVDLDSTYTPTPFYETTPEPPTTFIPTVNYIRSSTRKPKSRSRVTFLPTVPSVDSTVTPTFASKRIKPTTLKSTSSFKNYVSPRKSQKSYTRTSPRYEEADSNESELLSHKSTEYNGQRLRVPQDVVGEESNVESVRPLNEILKENGLKEMAKFLDQSGLDTILNETGPYTIFIPTDKAFRTLEDQLGGPDKAEDKFKENPRLLSGLLLHHVVPGSFRLEDLQDEMTGVSLAGTQLRVNTYTPEEKEGSRHKVVTINGARISTERKDISVPQGLAHAIDRVLFPLPVGDIVQTLRGDRERRFTKFLKSLESSGLTDMLTGSKTYTVFAPTDKAFSVLTDSELDKLLTRREAAKTIVLRHVVPGTLYSAGMNYFQVKDSMESGQKIVLKKELGKIKANSAQITSANIPATNGVIHAVESLL